MDTQKLTEIAKAMMAEGKGLLAMDESGPTCDKRFDEVGIEKTVENRRAYRELIITTPEFGNYISGMILFDETVRQQTKSGVPFITLIEQAGIIPGVKVDEGLKDMPDHPDDKVTKGLDGLPARLAEYFQMGARFAKWRAAFTVSDVNPSPECIEENAKILAEYAWACQEAGIVPMVEPEVLMDGAHTLGQCEEVTEKVLKSVFKHLAEKGVVLEGMILKPNMVVPGLDCPTQESVEEVADATVKLLMAVVPANVAGVAFLSGGQPGELASARLNAMNKKFKSKLPWPLTFSYSRAIQYPALQIWAGKEENISAAQKALLHRAKLNQAARRGEYEVAMEKEL